MKRWISFLFLCAVALAAFGQTIQEELKDLEVGDQWIYNDYQKAVSTAKATGKPLFVLFRCVPCDACSMFDQKVIRNDSQLKELTNRFVAVRVIRLNDVDLSQFQYDYDLSWSAFLMNADGTIYGRYGTRTTHDSETHISVASLKRAMERALELHKNYPDNKSLFANKKGPKPKYASAREIKSLAERMERGKNVREQCVHCHMINDGINQAAYEERKFDINTIWVYPFPENVGMTMNVDEGTTIQKVTPGSFADKAGLKAGDVLETLNGQAILSQADIQWVLHWLPTPGTVQVAYQRAGKPGTTALNVNGTWRKTDISWRASMWGLRPKPGFWAPELSRAEKTKLGIAPENLALKVQWVDNSQTRNAGLREGDILISFDGSTKHESPNALHTRVRLTYDPYEGKNVPATVIREGQKVNLMLPLVR